MEGPAGQVFRWSQVRECKRAESGGGWASPAREQGELHMGKRQRTLGVTNNKNSKVHLPHKKGQDLPWHKKIPSAFGLYSWLVQRDKK